MEWYEKEIASGRLVSARGYEPAKLTVTFMGEPGGEPRDENGLTLEEWVES